MAIRTTSLNTNTIIFTKYPTIRNTKAIAIIQSVNLFFVDMVFYFSGVNRLNEV